MVSMQPTAYKGIGRDVKAADSGNRTPRLPKLQANVNKRAQQIISAHMHSAASAASSTMTVPVLTQIDSTAPRTAMTHDISHRMEESGFLRPRIPPSQIDEADHVYETSFLAKDSTSVYSEADGLWHTRVFPSSCPSSRQDAVLLDAWITRSLQQHGERAAPANRDDLAKSVEALVPILSVSLHEIVRQVTHQCAERGTVLDKIWKTYVELFERVLHQMQESLRLQKQRTVEVTEVLQEARKNAQRLRSEHPEQMHKIIADLESQFTSRQQQYEEDLGTAENENATLKDSLREHHRELELWYPHFNLYQDSYVKNYVPQYTGRRIATRGTWVKKSDENHDHPDIAEDEIPPEVAIAEDFKRLLAVLAPEKRKMIGRELAPIMDSKHSQQQSEREKPERLKHTRLSMMATAEEAERKQIEDMAQLQAEVSDQEAYIKKLRAEIARLERGETIGAKEKTEPDATIASAAAEAVTKVEKGKGEKGNEESDSDMSDVSDA